LIEISETRRDSFIDDRQSSAITQSPPFSPSASVEIYGVCSRSVYTLFFLFFKVQHQPGVLLLRPIILVGLNDHVLGGVWSTQAKEQFWDYFQPAVKYREYPA